MRRDELERSLREILHILREYLEDLVLVGGWVPHLHLEHGTLGDGQRRTSLTTEADLVISTGTNRGARAPIVDILGEAGFRKLGPSGAVWVREPERGERIEFFRRHRGPAGSRGEVRSVPQQPGLHALALDHLWILEEFTDTILLSDPSGEKDDLSIRLPSLAAFILNKANTFNLRGGPDGEKRAGKDLLYLRDIAAAGDEVTGIVREDLESMLEADRRDRVVRYLHRGIVHLRRVAPRFHPVAGEMLSEREGWDRTTAEADVEGHLTDLVELLESVAPDESSPG